VSWLRLLPPLGWTVLIAWLSTNDWGSARTGVVLLPLLQRLLPWAAPEQLAALHWLARKTAHVVEYGVLAASWRWALATRGARRAWLAPLGLSILTAALDELHQSAMPSRSARAADILLDAAGASAALIALDGSARAAVRWLTGGLLWVAAGGGMALLVLNWLVGAPSGWLWWSVPAAWIALAIWFQKGRRE